MLIRLVLAACAATVCALTGLELRYRLDSAPLLLAVDPVVQARKLGDEGRWAEARMLADFVVAHPGTGDPESAAVVARRAQSEIDSFWGTLRRFGYGAATGEPVDTASLLGSLSLDFFVIGDIRDLAVQGWRHATDGSGDNFIMALSAVGLATTLAPEIDWAPAMLKAFRRSGALNRRLVNNIGDASRRAVRTGDYSAVSKTVTDLGGAARRLGPGPLRGVMKFVDDADDLARVARAAEIDAQGTYAVATLFGKTGVKRLARDGSNITTLVASIKTGSRVVKIARKATHVVPTPGLFIAFLIGLLTLYVCLRPRGIRAKKSKVVPPRRAEPQLAPGPDVSGPHLSEKPAPAPLPRVEPRLEPDPDVSAPRLSVR